MELVQGLIVFIYLMQLAEQKKVRTDIYGAETEIVTCKKTEIPVKLGCGVAIKMYPYKVPGILAAAFMGIPFFAINKNTVIFG